MIDLNRYGWNDKLNQLKQESTYGTLTHGRVAIVHRTCYEVVAGSGVFRVAIGVIVAILSTIAFFGFILWLFTL